MQFFSKRRSPGRPTHPDVLTPAEWRVLDQVRAGRTNQEIADHLGVSHHTVKTHVSNMLAKLGVEHRHELAVWRGAPAEASRTALGRLSLAIPWAGRIAAIGGAVVAAVLFLVAMQAMDESGSLTGASARAGTPIPTETEVPTEEPAEVTPTGPIGEPGRFPTGLPFIDETVVDVIDGDVEALVARMQYEERVCASDDAPSYNPRCEDLGLPPGSTYMALPMGNCDVGGTRVEDVPAAVDRTIEARMPLELWSIFEPAQQAAVTPSALTLTFAAPRADDPTRTSPVLKISMRNEAIVGIFGTSCSEDVPAPDQVSKWIVHPADLATSCRRQRHRPRDPLEDLLHHPVELEVVVCEGAHLD